MTHITRNTRLVLQVAVAAILLAPAGIPATSALWVAVGDNGLVSTSADAVTWTPSQTMYGVAYGGGRWVAVGNYGTIMTSTNGLDWTVVPTPTSVNYYTTLRDVAYAGGTWVIVGTGGTILTSTTGTSFTLQCPGSLGCVAGEFKGVAHHPDQWVIVRSNTGAGAKIATSPGAPWTWTDQASSSNNYPLMAVAANGAEMVAVGGTAQLRGSDDALVWGPEVVNAGTTTPTFSGVASDGTRWVATAGAKLYGRAAGASVWDDVSNGNFLATTNVAGNNGVWVATTNVPYGSQASVLRSTNGLTWTSYPVPVWFSYASSSWDGLSTNGLNDVASSGSLWVAVGNNGALISSPDGITWTMRNPSLSGMQGSGVAYGNGMWVAVGINYYGPSGWSSVNGVQWTPITSLQPYWTYYPQSVAYGNGRWVVVGLYGYIHSSTNLATWTPATTGTGSSFYDVAWNGSSWVAVGASGTIRRSADGLNWLSVVSPTFNTLYNVAWSVDRWIATGDGVSLTSTDGTTWTSSTAPSTMRGIASRGCDWVNVGYDNTIRTFDGTSWTNQVIGSYYDLYGVVWGQDAAGTAKWVAVGEMDWSVYPYMNRILTSPTGAAWTAQPVKTYTTFKDVAATPITLAPMMCQSATPPPPPPPPVGPPPPPLPPPPAPPPPPAEDGIANPGQGGGGGTPSDMPEFPPEKEPVPVAATPEPQPDPYVPEDPTAMPVVAEAGPTVQVASGNGVALQGGADGAVSFAWMQVDGPPVQLSGTDSDRVAFSAPALSAGPERYRFMLTATGALGQTGSDTVDVVVYPPLAITASDEGNLFTRLGTNVVVSDYTWTLGDGTTSAGALPLHRFPAPGTYRVEVTVRDGAYEASAAADVNVGEAVTVAARPPTGDTDAVPRSEATVPAIGSTGAGVGIVLVGVLLVGLLLFGWRMRRRRRDEA